MAAAPESSTFHADEPGELLARMGELAESHRGWVNLRPVVGDERLVPPTGGTFSVFSGGGPPVPLCTWSPGEQRRRNIEPSSIGIQHRAGPRAARRLAEGDLLVPEGWVVVQDHPRRGLVVRLPADAAPEDALRWLLVAGRRLCAVPTTGWWTAAIFPGQ